MNRRNFLTGLGVASVASVGGSMLLLGGNENTTANKTEEKNVSDDEVPDSVKSKQPLAREFLRELSKTYQLKGNEKINVLIPPNNGIIVEYDVNTDSADSVEKRIDEMCLLYADVLKEGEYEVYPLSVVVDFAEAILPVPALESYVDGRLKEEALKKSIVMREINR